MSPTRPLTRSEMMSRIRGKDTKVELVLRRALWSIGLRYRKNRRISGARPDIVFAGRRVVVFVDGCFWHGCPQHFVMPRSNHSFWREKLTGNFQRDRKQTLQLEGEGWRVLRFWEHEVEEELDAVVGRITGTLAGTEADGAAIDWRVVRVEPVDGRGTRERLFLEDLRDASIVRTEDRDRSPPAQKQPSEAPD